MPSAYVSLAMTNRTVDEVRRQQRQWSDALLAQGIRPVVPEYSPREDNVAVVERDFSQIAACDGLLIDLSRPSWGAAMELHHMARVLGRPCVGVFAGALGQLSPFAVYHCDFVRPTVRSAAAYLRCELGDGRGGAEELEGITRDRDGWVVAKGAGRQ